MDGVGRLLGHLARAAHPAHPLRHGACQRLDVAAEWCIQVQVVAGVVAHDVHHRRVGAARIVHVGQCIGQAGTCVQQGARGLFGHARIAVCSAGDHALEQSQHAAHLRLAVQRRDEVHLRRTGVGKAHVHVVGQQRVHQHVGAVLGWGIGCRVVHCSRPAP
ncbi:hypothetical protein SDC9_106157 [bioreactor metagenome]|uniref:Uncharacterized protein n=1 Tax=bioreactor metagenome TaxID=1076179 RepID=A0A645B1N9_9ZZZZ